ncbi:MAG: hypothetical protein ACOYM3_30500 [Terrimicrobiaceae bacterium]
MNTTNKKNTVKGSAAVAAALAVLMISSLAGAETYSKGETVSFTCSTDRSSQCKATYHAIQRKTDDVVTWGNLVAGYQCLKGVCTPIPTGAGIPYDFELSALDKFCKLLVKPSCKGTWESEKR